MGQRAVRDFFTDRTKPVKKNLAIFDYDGTLTPIVSNPHKAIMSQAVEERLEKLSKDWILYLVTGRAINDVSRILKPSQIKLFTAIIGNHGIENPLVDNQVTLETTTPILKKVQDLLTDIEGFELEAKGYSLTLHYRDASFPYQIEQLLNSRLSSSNLPIKLVGGKCVINVLPEGLPDKGDAVCSIMKANLGKKAIFLGDDTTDEDVFSLNDENLFGVHVGQANQTKAKYYFEEQQSILIALELLEKISLIE